MSALESFFNPRAVAVVGASKTAGKIGHSILRNIILSGYQGSIYPVNPKETEIEGLACYPAVSQLPAGTDVAVISIPAAGVTAVADECGRAGIKHLIVITAGFREVGRDGLELEKRLLEVCRHHGLRMLGPNCVGMMDTATPINATFAASFANKGETAFISQSGALCVAILDWSAKNGLGFSKFVSLGNKADLNEADLIEDAGGDPNTKVILCYMESVVDGARLIDVAKRTSRRKPIVIMKSGISQAGAQAASSHTGALAGSDVAYETAFRQSGIIRARTMGELFDLASAFATQPIPAGRRVAIVTNSGGPGIITSDAIETLGLRMARFTKETIDALRSGLPAEANLYNPVDVIGDANADRYRFALERVLTDENVDSCITLLSPTAVLDAVAVSDIIIAARASHRDKPMVAAYMGGAKVEEGAARLTANGIPCYDFPEPAIGALAGLSRYGEHLKVPADEPMLTYGDVDRAAVASIFQEVRNDRRVVLLGSEASGVASAYRIPNATTVLARTPEAAVKLAEQVGYPVVLKVASPEILHKTDVGGVKIKLATAEAVRQGFIDILDAVTRYLPNARIYGIEVQPMMPQGTELIIGMSRDLQFGPLIMFGLGGIYVNLLKDVSFRLAEGLTRREILDMLGETKAVTLLRGFRGETPRDTGAIIEAVGRVAQLVRDFPQITELDINPLFSYERGLSALDVKITIS